MTLLQFLAVLRARWVSAAAVFATVMVLVVAVTMLMPKRYTATASAVIDIKSPDPITGMALASMAGPSLMATHVDIMQSTVVARNVIEKLGLANNAALRREWESDTEGKGDFEGWLVNLIRRNLDVKPSRDSSALTVTYKSPDATFAATMANTFVQAFIDTSVDLRAAPAREFSTFFEQRAKEARDRFETAQQRLSAMQREKGLLATDERLDIETARLQELSSQVVMLQALAAESSGRANLATGSGDRLQEVLNNQAVATMRIDLSRQQARLEELTSRLGEQNPQVVEVKATIADLRQRLAAESERVAGSVTSNNSVTQGRLAQVQASLAEQRARVLRLKAERDEVSVLQRDLENAQTALQTILQRANQTAVEAQATRTNVSFLERAYVPPEPSSPKTVLNIAIGLCLALGAGLATALAREFLDRRLRTVSDVGEHLDLPLLGSIPNASPRSLSRDSSKLTGNRLLAGLIRA